MVELKPVLLTYKASYRVKIMSSPNEAFTLNQLASCSPDLYDQDRYSIPDDELQTVTSSTSSYEEETAQPSMLTDQDHSLQESAGTSSRAVVSKGTSGINTDAQGWMTVSTQGKKDAARHYMVPETPLHEFDPRMIDRSVLALRKTSVVEASAAFNQLQNDEVVSDDS